MYTPVLTVSVEFFRPEMITKKLPAFVDQLREFFNREPVELNGLTQVPPYKTFWRSVDNWDYADLREIRVAVPAGLSVPYLQYYAILEKCITVNQRLIPAILVPYTRWISELIEDASKLASLAGSRSVNAFEPHDIEGLEAQLGSCFQLGSNVTQRQFKDLFDRNADVKPVYNEAEELVKGYLQIQRKDVMAKVQAVSELLDVLLKRLDTQEAGSKLTENSRVLLAKMTHSLAREVEFYALIGYQLNQLSVALLNTKTAIVKKF
jgi:hypothetical protein